jgi:hypothetical protein
MHEPPKWYDANAIAYVRRRTRDTETGAAQMFGISPAGSGATITSKPSYSRKISPQRAPWATGSIS